MAVAGCVCALAEPSVLEIGYKPPEKSADAKASATLDQMLMELSKEPKGKEDAASPSKAVVSDPELEAKNTDLSEDNEQLRKELAEERAKVRKLERALPKEAKQLTGRPAKITSDSTVYNRKEGIASFEGHVHVDDEQYQMHADRVYLFLEGTNELKRIVAIGNVAMTNEARRAYGAKATYSKKNGLVVLYSGDGITAEVRDESKAQDQIVRGKRIRFWVGSEQVEVDEADLTGAAPAGGAASLKKALGK
jgi:lipopolysaccharide transport protein LptA